MFYAKQLKAKSIKRVRLHFTDFSKGINAFVNDNLLPQKYAVTAYNLSGKNGALKHCKGVESLKLKKGFALDCLNSSILKLYFFKRYDPETLKYNDKLLAYTQDKKLYYADIEGENTAFTLIEGVSFEKPPSGINYRLNSDDVIILCSEKDLMTVWDGKNAPYTVENAPLISTMCVHYERLFATVDGEKSAVWFSDDLDPTNWDISLEEAGFIEINDEKGSLLKVIKFLDYVYIFRSYGISRLTAFAEQTEFSIITLFVSSGKIYPDTVSVCGDRIIFLASDGLFCFDGMSAVKILDGIFPMFKGCDNTNAVSQFFNGCYYLACKLNYGNGGGESVINNTLLEYDITLKSADLIKGLDISSLCVISTENYTNLAIALRGGRGGQAAMLCEENRFFETPLLKCWKTPTTDFNCPDRFKMIKEIYLNTETDITLAVNADNVSKMIFISGGKGVKKANVRIKGKCFSLSFFCGKNTALISKPLVIADIL